MDRSEAEGDLVLIQTSFAKLLWRLKTGTLRISHTSSKLHRISRELLKDQLEENSRMLLLTKFSD